MDRAQQRYTAVAIVLHWAIAIAIFGMIPLGWWMASAIEDKSTQAQAIAAFQLHKSIGLTVLALSVARLAWRLIHPPPPLPKGMKPWERLAAIAAHWAFYFLIIAMPLTGWLYVSAGWSVQDQRPLEVPTLFFGLFQVPHLFGLAHLAEQTRATLAAALQFSHSKLAWGAIVLSVLHAGAALKHHFADKDDVLERMVPGLAKGGSPRFSPRALALAGGFVAIAVAAGGALWLFEHPPASTAAAPAAVVQSQGQGGGNLEGGTSAAPAAEPRDSGDRSHAPAAPSANAGAPPAWIVSSAASSIGFSGVHAGTPFQGRFGAWRADIRFDPNNLSQSSATVIIQTGSASDGVPLHDQSLPQAEWFDAASHPNATFRTSEIRARGGNAYEARGTLTIKGRAIDARLPFTVNISGDRATMDGSLSIDRKDANLGMASDPDAEYVSREIAVRVHVEARRAP